jgi:SAM-dependent methyltransferase
MRNERSYAYATAQNVRSLEDCWWYHSMDLPRFGPVTGQWDLRGRLDDYIGRVPLSGRTVLDVGTASGFLSFEAEKRGAIVTGFDADDVSRYQYIPPNQPGLPGRFPMMRNGYWLAHSAYESDAKVIYGDVYRLSELVPAHDVVVIGLMLVHLRDPLEALHQASLVAKDTLIVTDVSFHSRQPRSVFLGNKRDVNSWWQISDELYRRWLALLGFEVVSVTQNQFICTLSTHPAKLWTFVARRSSKPDEVYERIEREWATRWKYIEFFARHRRWILKANLGLTLGRKP